MNHYYKQYQLCIAEYMKYKQFGGANSLMLVFDFDQTVSKISVPDEINRKYGHYDPILNIQITNEIINRLTMKGVMSDPFLDPKFIYFLQKVKHDTNVKIIIASYGLNDSIKLILNKQGILNLFDYIITPINFGFPDGYEYFAKFNGKNKMIKWAQYEFKKKGIIIPDSNVMLIDDHPKNIQYAEHKYATSLVSLRYGITDKNVKQIKQFIYNRINSP